MLNDLELVLREERAHDMDSEVGEGALTTCLCEILRTYLDKHQCERTRAYTARMTGRAVLVSFMR